MVLLSFFAIAEANGAVLVVDVNQGSGSDYSQIHEAVDAAQDGDTILVRPGNYKPAIVAKSLSILSYDRANRPRMKGGLEVRHLTPSQFVHIRGIEFGPGPTVGLTIKDNGGKVVVESCVIRGAHGQNEVFGATSGIDGAEAARVQMSAAVTFVRCEMYGGFGPDLIDEPSQTVPGDGGDGLLLVDSRVAVYDCLLIGGGGGNDIEGPHSGGSGGNGALVLQESEFFASGSRFEGRSGGFGGFETFSGCGSGGSGGYGLRVTGGVSRHLDCEFLRGKGGAGGGPSCSDGADGQTVSGSQQIVGLARSLEVESPVAEQSSANAVFAGRPGDQILVFASTAAGFQFFKELRGTLLVPATTSALLDLGIGIPGSATEFRVIFPIPSLPAGISAIRLTLQPVFLDGSATLGSPSVLTLLDG